MQNLFSPAVRLAGKTDALKNFKRLLAGIALSGLLVACGGTATQSVTSTRTAATSSATTAISNTTGTTTTNTTTQTGATASTGAQKFNLNTVTAEQILTIPNAGSRMVREFQEYKPYTSILQFRKAIGKYVDATQVAEYEKYLYVPINPNEADAATLQQLPGVDETIANQLIASRPYASTDAFLKALATHVTADQAASASTYLER